MLFREHPSVLSILFVLFCVGIRKYFPSFQSGPEHSFETESCEYVFNWKTPAACPLQVKLTMKFGMKSYIKNKSNNFWSTFVKF